MAHSFLPPSGAADWSRCALWPTMNAQFPQDESPETLEGTAAHWIAFAPYMNLPYRIEEGSLAPNGAVVTDEMLDGAKLLQEVVKARMALMPSGTYIQAEETVSIPQIHENCFGTPDLRAFAISNAHLELIDYKFGHGFVDEYWNLQGLLYALGIIEKLAIVGDRNNISVSFTIVQPRCYYSGKPVRTHSYTIREAFEYIQALEAAAHAAYEEEPKATTGPQCNNCPGRHACPTLQKAAYSDAEYSSRRQPHTLTPQAAALELRMLERAYERLGARVESLQELTLANLKAGASIPYYRAEASKGRAQWTLPDEQIITIGKMLDKDLSKITAITPSQAKKIIDPDVISAYSNIIPGKIKLVAENNQDVAKIFGLN